LDLGPCTLCLDYQGLRNTLRPSGVENMPWPQTQCIANRVPLGMPHPTISNDLEPYALIVKVYAARRIPTSR
ncbi:MAG: hypothetical protein K2G21_10765, partial [Muribaculaceae bacterium]|nr:hypothetical protein [Muribaculaceae bacterium]